MSVLPAIFFPKRFNEFKCFVDVLIVLTVKSAIVFIIACSIVHKLGSVVFVDLAGPSISSGTIIQ